MARLSKRAPAVPSRSMLLAPFTVKGAGATFCIGVSPPVAVCASTAGVLRATMTCSRFTANWSISRFDTSAMTLRPKCAALPMIASWVLTSKRVKFTGSTMRWL